MKTAIIKFEDGDTITTGFNGTDDEIRAYYLNNYFNLGDCGEDRMVKVISVEILPE